MLTIAQFLDLKIQYFERKLVPLGIICIRSSIEQGGIAIIEEESKCAPYAHSPLLNKVSEGKNVSGSPRVMQTGTRIESVA